jgi:hypothetical protein
VAEPVTTTIAVGVVTNFVYDIGKKALGKSIGIFAPNLVLGRHEAFLTRADAVCGEAIREYRKRSKYESIKRYFDDPNLSENAVIKAILSEIFTSEKWDGRRFNKTIKEFQDKNDEYKLDNYDDQLENLRIEIKHRLVEDSATADYVLYLAVQHIRELLRSLPSPEKLANAMARASVDEQARAFTRAYTTFWQGAVKHLLINGLDAGTRREQILNDLKLSFVPISVSQLNPLTGQSSFASAEDAFDTLQCLILRGDAGSGKTTLIHKMILDFEVTDLEGANGQCVPIYIPLRRIERNIAAGYTIERAIADTLLDPNLRSKLPLNWLEDVYLSRGLTFLFDGLDEARSDNRPQVWRLINTLLKNPTLDG